MNGWRRDVSVGGKGQKPIVGVVEASAKCRHAKQELGETGTESQDGSSNPAGTGPTGDPYAMNWYFGWGLILSAFVTGGGIGLFFDRDDFLGGYASFPRRLLRLGHIAQAALGILNVLYALAPVSALSQAERNVASLCFLVGGISMPAICFLTAWKRSFRRLFAIPVLALVLAVILTLRGGLP